MYFASEPYPGRRLAGVLVDAAHGEFVGFGSLRRIADGHLVAHFEIVLLGHCLRDQHAVVGRLVVQLLALDHFERAVVVDFRRIVRVEGLQRQVAAGLVLARVAFRRDRLQRLAGAHRHRRGERVFERQVVLLHRFRVLGVHVPRHVIGGVIGVRTVVFRSDFRARPNYRRSFLRLVCFVIRLVVGSQHRQIHGG